MSLGLSLPAIWIAPLGMLQKIAATNYGHAISLEITTSAAYPFCRDSAVTRTLL